MERTNEMWTPRDLFAETQSRNESEHFESDDEELEYYRQYSSRSLYNAIEERIDA